MERKSILQRVFSNFFSIVLTLASIIVADQLQAFENTSLGLKLLYLLAIFVAVICILYIWYLLVDFYHYIVDRLNIKNKGIIFPHKIKPVDVMPFMFKDIQYNYFYTYDESTDSFNIEERAEYQLIAANAETTHINHIFKCSDKDIENGKVELRAESLSEKNGIAKAQLIKDDEMMASDKMVNHHYRVEFQNALAPGQEIRYAVIFNRKCCQPAFETATQKMASQESIPILETQRFKINIQFPKNYKIIRPRIVVLGKSDIELKTVSKIYQDINKQFLREVTGNPPKASIVIDGPIPNLRYKIEWCLPTKELLTQEGFFTK